MRSHLLALSVAAVFVLLCTSVSAEEDPFAAGVDALAVKAADGSASLRAKAKVKKISSDMVLLQVQSVDDSKYPDCVFKARVLKTAKSKAKHFKLMGRGKSYHFVPVLKQRGKHLDLKDKMTQANLGVCYYPKRTKLIVKVSGVDLKRKVFHAAEIYLK